MQSISIISRSKETLHIQVSNQCPQVPLEHAKCIFDLFDHLTAAERVTGTDLGPSICKGIIEAHGGRIWAENGPDLPLTWEGPKPPQLPMESETE